MLLDSTAVIDLLDQETGILKKIRELESRNERFCSTTISVFEVLQSFGRKTAPRSQEQALQAFDRLAIFDFDFDSATEAAKISRQLTLKGQKIDEADCMIAGIAKTRKETVLTRNVKHFSKIAEVRTETY